MNQPNGLIVGAALGVLCCATPVWAQPQAFPDASEWEPLYCDDAPMDDRFQDEAGALGPRDIVGTVDAPAGYRAFDDAFLFVRIRVDEDPTQGTSFRPFAWGVEFDVDGDLTTYEILMILDGVGASVSLYQNTTTTSSNDPTDPADEPPVASYSIATHARSAVATGSSFGDNPDYTVDFAVEWADLEALGLTPLSPIVAWVASSSTANGLDGDLACHDGASGPPDLRGTGSDPTAIDTETDTDGDGVSDADEIAVGTDPNDPDSTPNAGPTRLEGGGGCSSGGLPGPAAALWMLALVLAIRTSGSDRVATATVRGAGGHPV